VSNERFSLRRYLIAGLLVWVPLGITIWVVNWLLSSLDALLFFVPESWRPAALLGFNVPGLGALLGFLILLVTGVVAANFLGQRLIQAWEAVLSRIPFVKSIYSSVKQVSDTLLSDKGNAFRKALLVEFPREGTWTIAFLTGTPSAAIAPLLDGDYLSVYVPTTPNPTGGYFIIVRRDRAFELAMTVDDALKYIISMGVVAPRAVPGAQPSVVPAPPNVASRPLAPTVSDSRN
jgi:uncharacterized membrane protein